jgi:hypothetical protein
MVPILFLLFGAVAGGIFVGGLEGVIFGALGGLVLFVTIVIIALVTVAKNADKLKDFVQRTTTR